MDRHRRSVKKFKPYSNTRPTNFKSNRLARPINTTKGILDFVNNLIGGGPPPAPNINSSKYTYNFTSKTEYVKMVNKINKFVVDQITNATLKTATQLNLSQTTILENINVVGNVTIDTSFLQNAKVVMMSELTTSVMQNITTQIATSLSDSIMNQFSNDSALDTKQTLSKASSTSLVDSFLAPFTGSNAPSTQQFFDSNKNIEQLIKTNISTTIENSNTVSAATNVINSINADIDQVQLLRVSNLNVGGSLRLIGKFEQGLAFTMDVLLSINFAQNIINSINNSEYFQVNTNAIDTSVTKAESDAVINEESETVSDVVSSAFKGLLPIIGVVGGVLVVALVMLPKISKEAVPLVKEGAAAYVAVESGGLAGKGLNSVQDDEHDGGILFGNGNNNDEAISSMLLATQASHLYNSTSF